jgi:hypothetical protein
MKSDTHSELTESQRWLTNWQRLAQGRLWFLLLTAMGSVSSVIYPHPPLVGFAAIAGTTLKPKQAVLSAMAIWLASQLYGYGLRNYPQTSESLAWAVVMGLGTLAVTLLASLRPSFNRSGMREHAAWVAMSLGGGFLIFEGLVMSGGFLLTGTHILTLPLLGLLFWKEAIWAIALGGLHALLMRRKTAVYGVNR